MMTRRFVSAGVVGLVIVVTLTPTDAQRKTGDRAVRIARATFEKSVEERLAARRTKCMNAIGSPAFCDCLNGSLPLTVEFQHYIAVTTAGSDSPQLLVTDPKIASAIRATRNQCVSAVFAPEK
jgi:hypothetical protein